MTKLKVILDTSVLSDPGLNSMTQELERNPEFEFSISVITHFEILWGYALACRDPTKYEKFLDTTKVDILPLSRTDAELSAKWCPTPDAIRDAFIAATVKRYNAILWTRDSDFLGFPIKDQVKLIS